MRTAMMAATLVPLIGAIKPVPRTARRIASAVMAWLDDRRKRIDGD